jgi:hypothetical protein
MKSKDNAVITKVNKSWNVKFSNTGKSMPIPWKNIPDDWENEKVEVTRENGSITLIQKGDISLSKPQADPPRQLNRNPHQTNPQRVNIQNNTHNNVNNNRIVFGRAPYNFVPLNNTIIPSDSKETDHSVYNNLSGVISVDITVKTPLFIRGKGSDFFSINGNPAIPGSTFRGLIRNILSMISYAKFEQFEDKVLYKRSNRNQDGDEIKQGFMTLNNNQFYIREITNGDQAGFNGTPHIYEFNKENCVFSVGNFDNNCRKWNFPLNFVNDKGIEVNNKVIQSYIDDSNRDEEAVDIILSLKNKKIVNKMGKLIKNNDKEVSIPDTIGIPVFFRKTGEKISSFGHAKYHRIPYNHSIGEHVNQTIDSDIIDFITSIFGTKKHAGKVLIEDILVKEGFIYEINTPARPKILSTPKPTSYQLYLEQVKFKAERIKLTWNDKDAIIRGYKNYWHKNPSTWIDSDPKKSNPEEIRPISPGAIFSNGKIRFDNLTGVELGALLSAIQLPEGCYHKLGMCKPLGLGSVHVKVKNLTIIDRTKRYKTIFSEEGKWELGENNKNESISDYKSYFSKYILEKLPENEKVLSNRSVPKCFWDIDRMQKLKEMLTYDWSITKTKGVNWENRTRYQEQIEFNQKNILPDSNEVIDDNTYTTK